MTHDDRAEDTRIACALIDALERSLFGVIDQYQRVQLEGTHGPVFLRYITLQALTEVLGALLKDAIEADEEKARQWAREAISRLESHIGPRPTHLH